MMRILMCLIFLLIFVVPPTLAHADEDNDMAAAQDCFDHIRPATRRQALGCTAGIEQYNDGQANLLKCSADLMYAGWDLFGYPLFLDNSDTYPLIEVMNKMSDLDVDQGFGRRTRAACAGTGTTGGPLLELLGSYVYMKSVFLQFSLNTDNSSIVEITHFRDPEIVDQINEGLQRIIYLCDIIPRTAPLHVWETNLCLEPYRIRNSPGPRLYERMLYRMRAYE